MSKHVAQVVMTVFGLGHTYNTVCVPEKWLQDFCSHKFVLTYVFRKLETISYVACQVRL
jgi:hypothetical protein